MCYGDKFLGGKSGLGLVADLGEARTGTIAADVASAPYQVEVFTADRRDPTDAGQRMDLRRHRRRHRRGHGLAPTSPGPRYVAVVFHELGPDTTCTRNRFRGKISEIAFQPS